MWLSWWLFCQFIYFHSSILAGAEAALTAAVGQRRAEAEEVLMFPCQCFSQRQQFTGSETDRVTHTHTNTLALRLFLISCVASAQQREGGHDDVKMG